MGISAAIAGVASAATAANAIGGLVGGGTAGGLANNAVGTGISTAAQLQAGQIQQAAADKSITQQMGVNANVMGTYDPLTSLSGSTFGGLQNLLGVGPQGSAGMLSQLQQTPGYQFQLQQGEQQALSQLSGMGLAKSGSAIKAVTGYAEGLAGTTYQNMVSNFMNGGTLGLNAVNSRTNAAFAGQNTINSLNLASGAAQASGIVGAANVLNTGLQGANALTGQFGPSNSNPSYGGTPVGNAVGAMLTSNPNSTATSDVLSQNPYQIQPTGSVAGYNPANYGNDLNFTPTLPT